MKHNRTAHIKSTARTIIIVAIFALLSAALIVAGLFVRNEYIKYSGMTNGTNQATSAEGDISSDAPADVNDTQLPIPGQATTPVGESDDHIPAGALNPVEDFSAGDVPEPEESATYSVVYQNGYTQPVMIPEDISREEFALEVVE